MRGANLRNANLRGADLRDADLHVADLGEADVSCTDLRGASLRDADLYGVCLNYANLHGAILYGVDLRYSELQGVDLRDVNLRGSNLYGADMCGIYTEGLPSGSLLFLPTADGWHVTIGCWSGTLGDLRVMLDGPDEGWPEAEGVERETRERMLRPLIDMCEAYADAYTGIVSELDERWNKE